MRDSTSVYRVRIALYKLSPLSRDIIVRRYGLLNKAESLSEVSTKYSVTTERIRQVVVKGLRMMRRDVQRQCSDYSHILGAEIWQQIVGDEDYLMLSDLQKIREQLTPWFSLALDVCNMDFEDVLDKFADRYGNGWVGKTWRIGILHECFTKFEQRLQQTALPCPLVGIEPREIALVRTVLGLNGYSSFGTYVLTAPPGTRIRRALRLHAILSSSKRITNIMELTRRYRAQARVDIFRARNCEIAMEGQQQLFVHVMEDCWAAIGQPGVAPPISGEVELEDTLDEDLEAGTSRDSKPQTISECLEQELRRSGPCSISSLIQRAADVLPPSRSKNSIARVLNSDKDLFIRLLPGIYALHDQVPTSAQLLLAPPPCIFRKDQMQLYAMARRGGEQWGAYPIWLPETEFLWCMWAREQADEVLPENLLSIAQLGAWPKTEELGTWRELARKRSRFTFQSPPGTGAFVLPPLDRVLAACLYVRQSGRMSWVSGNRILMKSAHTHSSAGLLALLVALKTVIPDADDWQGPHMAGLRLNEAIERLEAERVRSADLGWNSRVGKELKEEALAAPPSGWVSPKLLPTLFGPIYDHTST
jgi:hypothetical protein